MELTPEQKKKLLSAAEIVDKGDLAVLTKIMEFQDFLEKYQEDKEQMETVLSRVEEVKSLCIDSDNHIIVQANKALTDLETSLKSQITALQGASIDEVKSLRESFNKQLDAIKASIPVMPDLSYFADRLVEIEQKIPELKETILDTPVELRDKLESLKDDERIDRSAVKGLEEFTTQTQLDQAIEILDKRTQYLLNKTTVASTGGSAPGAGVSSFNARTGDVVLNSGDVTTALGYTPFNWSGFTQGSVIFVGPSGTPAQDNTNFFFDDTNNRLGLLTTAPTHTITLASTSTGISQYNTSDQIVNYERFRMVWNGNVGLLTTENGGTGVARNIQINGSSTTINIGTSVGTGVTTTAIQLRRDSTSQNLVEIYSSAMQSNSGIQTAFNIDPVVNQSSTAGYTMLTVNPTETAVGNGTKLLMYLGVAGTSKLTVDNTGQIVGTSTGTNLSLNYDATHLTTFTTNSSGLLTITPSGGIVSLNGSAIQLGSANTNQFFPAGGFSGAMSQATTQQQFAGSTVNFIRTGFYGSTSTTLTTGSNYSGVIFANAPVTTFSSGTHPWLANVVVKALGTVTSGGATVTNTASLFIDGAGTGGTNNYALYSASGANYFGGSAFVGTYLGVNVPIATITGNTWTAAIASPAGTQNIVSLIRPINSVSNLLQFVPNGGNTTSNVNWFMGTFASSDDFSFGTYDGSSSVTRFTVSDLGVLSLTSSLVVPKTITAPGTNGAQTINKMSGSVNFAAGAGSLVVTNSLVTTSSIVQCTVGSNDLSMTSAQAVRANGSFTIFPNTPPTAACIVTFLITN